MNQNIVVTDDIYWIGVNDRKTDLFEALWPIPRGIAYNSYIIVDNTIALVDSVKAPFQMEFLEKTRKLLNDRAVDYLIINHMEPDHSGAIRMLREIYPKMEIVGNRQTLEFLTGFYGISEGFRTIGNGDTLSLGKHELEFHLTPMVHWPETMMTYDKTSKMLFSGDAFGGFGTLDGGIFDDELNMGFYEDEMLRYFSNIIGKYSNMVEKAINGLRDLDIKIVGSTHGPVLRKNPKKIINDYSRWSRQETEQGVVIVFGSMYGNTERMAEYLARSISENGIEKIITYDLSRVHISYIIKDIWKYRGLVLGSCTYNQKMFPMMEHLVNFFDNISITNHVLGIFGSYSWSGGAVKRLREFSEKGKWNLIDPIVETRFAPTGETFEQCNLLGKAIAEEVLK